MTIKRKKPPKNKIVIPKGFKKVKNKGKENVTIVCSRCNWVFRYWGSAKPRKGFKCPFCPLGKDFRKKKIKRTKGIRRTK